MVKFAKQLEVEAVPEWRAAYCDYKQLNKSLATIKEQAQLRSKSGRERHSGHSGFLNRSLESPRLKPRLSSVLTRRRSGQWHRTDFVQVNLRTLPDGTQAYETQLEPTAAPSPVESHFFAKLDQQLNKVNGFYRGKEAEYVQQAEVLKKQMEALLETKGSLDQNIGKSVTGHPRKVSNAESQLQDGSKHGSGRCVEVSQASKAPPAFLVTPQNLQGVPIPSPVVVTVEPVGGPEKPSLEVTNSDSTAVSRDNAAALEAGSSIVEILPPNDSSPLNQMIVSIPPTNPRATISAISQMFLDDIRQQLKRGSSDGTGGVQKKQDPAVSRKEVQYAANMLRTAYVEFYRGLTLLNSYRALNVVAFGKIMKKYDKVAGRRASPAYLEAVQASYFHSSDKVAKLMEKVEFIFTAHFTQHDRRRAMQNLRPLRNTASHRVTFFLGLLSGWIIALVAALAVVLRVCGEYWEPKSELPSYFDSIFQVFSMLALIVLHLYLYGWNVYLWRRARINYSFIFEFAPGKELRYREVLLVASGLLMLLLGGMLAHLGVHYAVDRGVRPPTVPVDIIPLAVVAVFVLLLFLPFNICYYSSRMFFLKCLLHLVMSPLYKVVLSDFFLGDQLTSQVPMLRNVEFFTCYYMGGFFTRRNANLCLGNKHYQDLAYVIALLPYYFRLMQCARRWFDEGDRAHVANGLKYLSAMVAVVMRMTYLRYGTTGWLVMVVITSVVATAYGLYWDLVVDWGLLQRHSKNPWLRDQLMLRSKAMYFLSMVANTLLRLAWLLSLNHLQVFKRNKNFQDFLVAALEVLRRGIWNFFRLENEHLNNVGKYRAVKTVPLPFREVVAEGADE